MKKPHMELDLDSFLVSDSDSESDLDSSSVPHRTVDEILNASSSSSASSSPPSSPPLVRDQVNRRNQNDPTRRLSEALLNVSVRPESVESEIHRVSDPAWRNSASSSSLRQLPLPSLFAGVRSNVKPGAALAAAVAASRLVPTPHAAIIKSRRASSASSDLLQQVLGAEESVSNQDEDDQEILSSNGNSAGVTSGFVSVDDFRPLVGESRLDNGVPLASQDNADKVMEVQASDITETLADAPDYEANSKPELVNEGDFSAEPEATTTIETGNADGVKDDTMSVASLVEPEETSEQKSQLLNDSDGKCFTYSQSDGSKVSNNEDSSVGDVKNDDSDRIILDSTEDGGDAFILDDGSSMSGISELVEERIGELEKERINKREKLKSRSFRKQLVLAEEFEKKQAYTGLHWEEGAAAQPMSLEGVKIGSTNLGYFDVDVDNIISRTISLQAFNRDHGSPQVLAVHLNFIAVGNCIMLVLRHESTLQPCKCPLCRRPISLLVPSEDTIRDRNDSPVAEVFGNLETYNRLFGGRSSSLVQRMQDLPFLLRRLLREMMDPQRTLPLVIRARVYIAMILSGVYIFSPIDIIPEGDSSYES